MAILPKWRRQSFVPHCSRWRPAFQAVSIGFLVSKAAKMAKVVGDTPGHLVTKSGHLVPDLDRHAIARIAKCRGASSVLQGTNRRSGVSDFSDCDWRAFKLTFVGSR